MDPTLGHVAHHEITDGYVVNGCLRVPSLRPECRLRCVARRPPASVEDGAILADEDIAGLRRDGVVQVMDARSETERSTTHIAIDQVLDRGAWEDGNGAGWARDRRLR